jgi:peptidoglycan DL-endopeptidase CwlO
MRASVDQWRCSNLRRIRPPLIAGAAFLLIFSILIVLPGCAPKKIKMYEEGSPQKGNTIIQHATGLLGRPYRSGAKGPDAFDCSGFVYYVFKRFNINVPYTTDELVRTGYQVPQESVLAGDLVIFNIKKSYHIGIMMNEREFVHASSSRGVAIDNLGSLYWRRTLVHFRRVP